MRKYVSVLVAACMIGAVQAEIPESVAGTVVDHYSDRSDFVEYPVTACHEEQVPVYEQRGYTPSGASILGGIIVGGILGKALSGDNRGAKGGAVLGGLTASQSRSPQIIGYHILEVCSEVIKYKRINVTEYSHSTISFTINDVSYNAEFVKEGF
jgi:hypothetical protein